MSDVSEAEARELANAFRPNRKPLIITVSANVLMAALLLGVPYWRGRNLAAEERRDFGAFARCLIGGEPASKAGLSLPRGDREHFAAKVLFAGADWPLSCRPALQKLETPSAIFLWPSVKQAGADVNAAVGLVDREMQKLADRRKRGPSRVPDRPIEALKRLQAAMVLYARAAGADADLDNDAIRFNDAAPSQLATPARLPLGAGESSTLALWSSDLSLEALALDGRGLSYMRLADGKIDRERVKRSSYVRGVVRAGATPYVVWATPDSLCKTREDRCANRPSGLAPYARGSRELSEPTWKLPGHPAGRVDRAIQITQLGKVDLIGRSSADGALEWIRVRLPESPPEPGPGQAKATLLEASEHWPIRGPGPAASAQLIPGDDGGAALYASEYAAPAAPGSASAPQPSAAKPGVASTPPSSQTAAANPGERSAALQAPGAASAGATSSEAGASVVASLAFPSSALPLQLPAASGSGPWAIGCALGDARYLAYGSTSQLRVVRVDSAHALRELAVIDRALRPPLDLEDPARDQVRLVCEGERAQLLFNGQTNLLEQISCDADSCSAATELARDVTTFAALATGDDLVLAYAGSAQAAVVRVLRTDRTGKPRAQPMTPAACWEPLGGMCGTPSLVRDTQRIILTARDGADILALESTDHAQSFTSLSGLVVGGSFEPSTTSPLQQHRVRKGLD